MEENALEKIKKIKNALPKKQKMLCNYIVSNPNEIGVMSVQRLAQQAHVGTTTVMRFVENLGYDSFVDFKQEILDAAFMQNTSPYRGTKNSFAYQNASSKNHLLKLVLDDMILMSKMLSTDALMDNFEKASELLTVSKNIYLLGLRSSHPLASYFEMTSGVFMDNIHQLSDNIEYVYDRILHMSAQDVLVVISIWPCVRATIEIAELCRKRNIPIIVITNSELNPLIDFADVVLNAKTVNHISGDTIPFAIIEALIAELGRRTAPASMKRIEELEEMLNENRLNFWWI